MTSTTGLLSRRRAPAGTPPGTLIHNEQAVPTSARLFLIEDDRLEENPTASIADIEAATASGRRLWVDVVGLGDLDFIERLGRIFSISALALEDINNVGQRPKVDQYGHHALIFMQMMDGKHVSSKEQLAIFFDKSHVLTIQQTPDDCLDPVRKRLAHPEGRMRRGGPAYLAYALIDTVIDHYFPLLEHIGEQLEELEDLITSDPKPQHVARLHDLKRELLVVKRALWPTREMLATLSRQDFDLVPASVEAYLRDTYDHTVQLIDIVETYRELSSGLLDLYLSSISTRMNEVMKVLTIVSTIFIPLTFLAGIWGMNFNPESSPWNMPELSAYYGYPLALAAMVLVGILLAAYFRWKTWL